MWIVRNSRQMIGPIVAAVLCLALSLSPAQAGNDAPSFTLKDLNRQQVSLSDYRGSVVLVNFWATWCGPCKQEMPHLDKMNTEFGSQGFVVLSISTDDARKSSQVKSYIRARQYGFTVLLDTESTAISQYNPSKSLPYTALIDRQGKIHKIFQGYTPGEEVELRAEVKKLVESGQ